MTVMMTGKINVSSDCDVVMTQKSEGQVNTDVMQSCGIEVQGVVTER